jgi:hypothetical protein
VVPDGAGAPEVAAPAPGVTAAPLTAEEERLLYIDTTVEVSCRMYELQKKLGRGPTPAESTPVGEAVLRERGIDPARYTALYERFGADPDLLKELARRTRGCLVAAFPEAAPGLPAEDAAERGPGEARRLYIEIQAAQACAVARRWAPDGGGELESLEEIMYRTLGARGVSLLEFGAWAERYGSEPEVVDEVSRRMMECYAPDAGGGREEINRRTDACASRRE